MVKNTTTTEFNNFIKKINNPSLGILFLRIFVGLRLFYGVIDNVISWEKMMEFATFLESFHFPAPILCAILSVYVQLIGSICILLGYKIRVASIILTFNFVVALVAIHFASNHSIEDMTPALAMFSGCLALVFTGAGKYSLN